MLLYLFITIIVLCVIHLLVNYNARARLIRKIPGPKMHFIIGNAFTFVRSPVDVMKLMKEFTGKWEGIFGAWIFPLGNVVIYNPEDIEIVISSMRHSDKSMVYRFLKPWLHEGLLISNETAMGTQLNEDTTGAARSYKQAIYGLGSLLFERLVRVYLYPDFLFSLTPWGRKQHSYLATVHSFTKSIIEKRKKYIENNNISIGAENNDDGDDNYVYKKKKNTAMLDLLIAAHKEGLIDKTGIQEEVDTFMFEGHDTTASGLTFFLMVLANHKTIQENIRAELTEIFGDTKRPIKLEDLNKMKYLDNVIKESLRMYPPVHFISRKITETTKLSNYTVPAGTICHILILNLHYDKTIFEDPERFDPDRFLPENSVGRHPYAYIPFSAGPRNCIGQKFAIMEMKIAIAKVLLEFDLVPVTRPEDIQFAADMVLRNDGPVFVNFVKRQL